MELETSQTRSRTRTRLGKIWRIWRNLVDQYWNQNLAKGRQKQTLSNLAQLQVVPVVRDEGQDLIQLKVFLLAADGQVVEDQVDQVHPAQRQPLHILCPLVAVRAQEEVEPEEK